MMFCDVCDRGYHTQCVDMKELPQGRWECEMCVKCACCHVRESDTWTFQVIYFKIGDQFVLFLSLNLNMTHSFRWIV